MSDKLTVEMAADIVKATKDADHRRTLFVHFQDYFWPQDYADATIYDQERFLNRLAGFARMCGYPVMAAGEIIRPDLDTLEG